MTCSAAYGGTIITSAGTCTVGPGTFPTYDYITSAAKYCNPENCVVLWCGNCCCSGTCVSCWGCTPATGGACDNGPLTVCSAEYPTTVTDYYCPGNGCAAAKKCSPNTIAGCQNFVPGNPCCKTKETDLPSGCIDGMNADCDTYTDCDDPDCFSDPECNGEDIGLRMFDGTTTHKISAQPIAATFPSKIRVKHNGLGRGIITVSSTHPMTLPLKVSVGGQKTSIRKYASTCTPATVTTDCGAPIWSGPTNCSGSNLMQNGSIWSCVNNLCIPGATTNQVKEVCECGCSAGACIAKQMGFATSHSALTCVSGVNQCFRSNSFINRCPADIGWTTPQTGWVNVSGSTWIVYEENPCTSMTCP